MYLRNFLSAFDKRAVHSLFRIVVGVRIKLMRESEWFRSSFFFCCCYSIVYSMVSFVLIIDGILCILCCISIRYKYRIHLRIDKNSHKSSEKIYYFAFLCVYSCCFASFSSISSESIVWQQWETTPRITHSCSNLAPNSLFFSNNAVLFSIYDLFVAY